MIDGSHNSSLEGSVKKYTWRKQILFFKSCNIADLIESLPIDHKHTTAYLLFTDLWSISISSYVSLVQSQLFLEDRTLVYSDK